MTSSINEADAFLFVITHKSLEAAEAQESGGAVKFEVQLATARKIAGEQFRFIGLLRDADRPPHHLRDARYVDFRNDDDYEHSLASLVADLMGVTSMPALPTEHDLAVLAESPAYRIWERIPHGGGLLVEPARQPLQEAIQSKLLQIIDANEAKRGYEFKALSVTLCSGEKVNETSGLDDLASLFEDPTKDLNSFTQGESIKIAHGGPQWNEAAATRRIVVLWFLRTDEPNELGFLRGFVRSFVQRASFNRTSSVGITSVIFSPTTIAIEHGSPLANCCELIQLRYERGE